MQTQKAQMNKSVASRPGDREFVLGWGDLFLISDLLVLDFFPSRVHFCLHKKDLPAYNSHSWHFL